MRIGAVVASTALLAASLTGCVRTMACAGFVEYSRPQDAYRDAVIVVAGEVGDADGTVPIEVGDGVGHRFAVAAAYKVDGDGVPSELRVAVGSDNCGPDVPDPLRAGDRMLLFLTPATGGAWRTLTPFDGYRAWDPEVNPFARTRAMPSEPRR